jgi:hypothetical protein
MPHTTRMSYKAKWLATAGADGAGNQVGRLQRCHRDVEIARAEVRAVRQAHIGLTEKHMTLAGALQDAAAVCNEFLDMGVLSFKPIRTEINIESVADIVMAATAIVTQMADRFGLVCAGLEEISGNGETDGTVAELRSEAEALNTLVTRAARPGRPRDLDTSKIMVAGKRLKFESLSPIDESPRWTLIPDEDTDESTPPRGRARQGRVGTHSPDVSIPAAADPRGRIESGLPASVRDTPATTRPTPIPPVPPRSNWPQFARRQTPHTEASLSAEKGKERATRPVSRSRSSTPSAGTAASSQQLPRSRPGVSGGSDLDYRAEIALLDDVDWETVRASLSRTDQLTVRGLRPADLASLVVDDPSPGASRLREASVKARLRKALQSVSAVKKKKTQQST